MKTSLVVTITCPDRPGIVERFTDVVRGFAANWEDSRMARLGGDFAGIVKIGVPADQAESLTEALRALADEQTTVIVKTAHAVDQVPAESSRLCQLRLSGADHEGIVHTISAYLAEQSINVEAMETEVVPAPMSASPVFRMKARIKLPPGLSLAELVDKLTEIGDQQGVDIELKPVVTN